MHALRPNPVAQRADLRERYKVSPFVTWAYLGLFFVPPNYWWKKQDNIYTSHITYKGLCCFCLFHPSSFIKKFLFTPPLSPSYKYSFVSWTICKLLILQCKTPFWNRPSWHVGTGNLSWASGYRKHAQPSQWSKATKLFLLVKQVTLCSICPQ